ncbi:hypothetical protein [Flavobacterium frigoris]|uniref:Uncharacterized protein n=1 Tax=Flavobacterium frigoris (strain PS1) TaxID=1086011 RepID=H7FTE8_FLAFP|nr:hypothetical protein [Flavobacterium frigoris]EIA08352.1 hypothetical protein HJ01_02074 [Flavobacterium frigoris PS1]
METKIGAVLSGGGARGIAHLGIRHCTFLYFRHERWCNRDRFFMQLVILYQKL